MNILNKIGAVFVLPAVAITFSGSVHAYSYKTCGGSPIKWNKGSTNMYISTTSFPASSSWDSRLQNAMWHWNNVKGSRFTYYVGRDTNGKHSNWNGKNEIYLDSSEAGSALAVTKTRYHCYWALGYRKGIDETDIAFNSNISWSTSSLNYSRLGSPYSFEGVALHELGHALGLKHENRWMSTMDAYVPNSGTLGHWKEWDALGDDRLGTRRLYPDSTVESDIAGSVFRRTGTGSSGLVGGTISARSGSYANVPFTFSNLGTSSKTFNIGFYLSTNSYISKYDTLLATNYGAQAPAGSTGTFSRWVYIPPWTKSGTYYLGFIVDRDGTIGENNEGNNYMEMPRTITIFGNELATYKLAP